MNKKKKNKQANKEEGKPHMFYSDSQAGDPYSSGGGQ